MVTLKLFNEDVVDSNGNLIPVNRLELYHRITVLSGCSGSGKTFLYSNLESAEINADGWSFECNKKCKIIG